eukprot:3013557-Amphidinium_carterae.1
MSCASERGSTFARAAAVQNVGFDGRHTELIYNKLVVQQINFHTICRRLCETCNGSILHKLRHQIWIRASYVPETLGPASH